MIKIKYYSSGFNGKFGVLDGSSVLETTWDDLLHAAITVGRPNLNFVFQHGDASLYEALFRLSLVRMALEQQGRYAYRLSRTDAFACLDPTEKGAVNYFLGMVFSKLFAEQLLNTPWMLHLDVFRPQLNAVLDGRSRPDLIGRSLQGDYIAIEAKGRVTEPDSFVKEKAKDQARRVVSVNGQRPKLCAACITFFYDNMLRFYWRDPEPLEGDAEKGVKVNVANEDWRYHYLPAMAMIEFGAKALDNELGVDAPEISDGIGVAVEIHPRIRERLRVRKWADAMMTAIELSDELFDQGYKQDGIRVRAGASWRKPLAWDWSE